MASIPEPTPQDYSVLFNDMPGGQQVLNDLVRRFGKAPFVKGGHEGDRQTCYNAGQLEVVNYILNQINRANGVNDE